MSLFDRTEIYAALDLGTTNCRLLVARPAGRDGMRVVDSFSRIVRLGEGLDAAGVLGEAAMARTTEALALCAAKLRHRRVTVSRLVATEACRRAANCGEFLERVEGATGLALEIISTAEEARLALAGCVPLLDPRRRRAIVFDIGGGSTEVLWVGVTPRGSGRPATEILGIVSVPHGVVSLTERFAGRPHGRATFDDMAALMAQSFARFDAEHGIRAQIARGGVQMLGSSGTVTTLAGIRLGLPRYDRARIDGVSLDFAGIEAATAMVIATDTAGRAAQPCIGPGRADLMVAGCAILAAICATWPVGRLRVADRGVREGILANLMAQRRRPVPLREAAGIPVATPAG